MPVSPIFSAGSRSQCSPSGKAAGGNFRYIYAVQLQPFKKNEECPWY